MQARSVLSGSAGRPGRGPEAPPAASGTATRPAAEAAPDFFERVRTSPLLTLILVLLMLVPIELSIRAGPLSLPWYRAILLVVAIPVFVQATRLRFAAFDWCMLVHALWTVLAMLLKRGGGGIEPGGSYLVETLVVYLVVRLVMTRPGHFTAVPRIMVVLMAPVILLAIPEALIVHRHFVHDIARQLTGYYYDVPMETRLGMLRAAATFEHPILYGLFCATPVALAWVTARSRARAITMTAVLCGGTVLSGSSAPMLVMAISVLLLIGERLSRNIPGRFRLLMGFTAFCFVFLEVFSNRGFFQVIAQELTLNPWTGYYRVLIWENGIDDVLANPFFGIRPEEWTRPAWMTPSIDNNWLLLGMKGGFPGVLLLLAAMGLIWFRLYRRDPVPHEFDRIRFGWSCVALALLLGGSTVAFFGKMQPFFFVLLGYGAALAHLDFAAGTEARRPDAHLGTHPAAQPDPGAPPAGGDDGQTRRRTWL